MPETVTLIPSDSRKNVGRENGGVGDEGKGAELSSGRETRQRPPPPYEPKAYELPCLGKTCAGQQPKGGLRNPPGQ